MSKTDWAGVIRRIAPKADPRFVSAFAAQADAQFMFWNLSDRSGIAGFLGQAAHESGGFRVFSENMNYSAERLTQVWPGRFPTLAAARPYAGHPERLANRVYANRMGNGPESSGDGWRNRGGGLFQHTGAAEYARIRRRTGHSQDEVRNPAMAGAMLAAALSYAGDRNMVPALRRGDVRAATRILNGGEIGLADRKILVARAEAALAGQAMPVARTTVERRDRAVVQLRSAAGGSVASGGAGAGAAAETQAPAKSGSPVPAPGLGLAIGLGLALAAVLAVVALWRWRAARHEQSRLDAERAERESLLELKDA